MLPDLATRVAALAAALNAGQQPAAEELKQTVRLLARAFAAAHPGRSVELRIPPYVAVQCVEGPRHTRGTPPNVVEMDAVTWLRLCTGDVAWADVVAEGRVWSSGSRANLSGLLPFVP